MIQRLTVCVGSTLGLTLCLIAGQAWGQQTPATDQPARSTEPVPATPLPGPPLTAYPLELLGLLAPPATRGPVTLTPSISVSEEYNDNIFQENKRRQSDFITSFSPALALLINKPSYQLSAGYSFTADIYAKESRFNNALDRQNFVASGFYRASPALTLSASDAFMLDRSTNVVAVQSTTTGRQESWINTFTPGLSWQMTQRDTLSLSGTNSVLRLMGKGQGVGSDTLGFGSLFAHAFTPRVTGTLGYNFTYLNLTGGQEDSKTHNPMLGLIVRITPTLTGTVSGGPAITEIGGQTFVSPNGSASLIQELWFGSASVQYSRNVSVAGGFGGTNETQTASAALVVTSLRPGLVVIFNPVYSESRSIARTQNEQIDVKAVNLNLNAIYAVAQYVNLFAGYSFLHQRTGSASATQVDVDQNRVRFGIQFGYPIQFD
jgi:hypothetical protein